MRKILSSILMLSLLTACGGSVDAEHFSGSDFSFDYPKEYDLKKAATMFVFENEEGEVALTMHRYLADSPGDVIEQVQSVGQECAFEKGGTRYGGYKAFTFFAEGECELTGSLVTNNKGIMMLIIENDPAATALKKDLKKTFKFN